MLLVLLFFLIGKNHAIEPIDLIMEINEESLLIQKLSTESVKNKKIESFYENYFVDGKIYLHTQLPFFYYILIKASISKAIFKWVFV